MINLNSRYQKGLTVNDLFPAKKGVCACDCNEPLTGKRRKWATTSCSDSAYISFAIVKGDTRIIRQELFTRDQGYCLNCGVFDEYWQADHKVPVHGGGGGSGLDNFQTLCVDCHQDKSADQMRSHRKQISSQAASTLPIVRL